jgi:hypothetical protein
MSRGRGLRVVALLASIGAISLGALALGTSNRASGSASRQRGSAGATASNRRAAVRDAKRRLEAVLPPTGAVLRSSGAALGAGAHLLTLAFASAVAYRSWTVPDDPASVLSFVQAHLPAGSSVVSRGAGGPTFTRSVIRSWPPVRGVLDVRWLEIQVTARPGGSTRLYAEAQSQWVIARPEREYIPAGVREVDLTDRWPGHPPFLSRRVTRWADVRELVTLFNSLGILQPVGISCPAEQVVPVVKIGFRTRGGGRAVAQAEVSSSADFSWPASAPGWACLPISFSVRGRNLTPLVGNVITPIERLLHLKLGRRLDGRS